MIKSDDIKTVILDCDGVMFDTQSANKAYYNRILAHFGKPPITPEQFSFVQQYTVYESIAHLFPDIKTREAALNHRKIMTYAEFIKDMEIEPHLVTLLKKLRPAYKTGIATNRSNTMDQVLQEHGIEEYFDIVVTAKSVANPKPAPDPLIMILNHFSLEPHQMLYVGDSKLDELAASAAGVVFAAYKNPELTADFHIQRLKEIEEILQLP